MEEEAREAKHDGQEGEESNKKQNLQKEPIHLHPSIAIGPGDTDTLTEMAAHEWPSGHQETRERVLFSLNGLHERFWERGHRWRLASRRIVDDVYLALAHSDRCECMWMCVDVCVDVSMCVWFSFFSYFFIPGILPLQFH